jgi:signal recognition particle GTPase
MVQGRPPSSESLRQTVSKARGQKVLLGAADTFLGAGAIDQLSVWATRAGVDFVGGAAGSTRHQSRLMCGRCGYQNAAWMSLSSIQPEF